MDEVNVTADTGYKLVSDDLIRFLELLLLIPLNCLISLMGVVANSFNVIVLARLGFKQNMSYGTMALSITDLTVSGLQLTSEICYVFYYMTESGSIDFMALATVPVGWMRYAVLNISGWITSLIATERCFCVIFPFHVKQICKRSVYIIALTLIYFVYFSFVIPIIILEPFTWQEVSSGSLNTSSQTYIYTVVFDDSTLKLEKLFDTICVLGFALLSQILLLVSTVYMACGIITSSQVRTSHEYKPHHGSVSGQSSLSLKEKRLISVAVWLAVVLLICSIPRYIIVAVFAIVPAMHAPQNYTLTNFLVHISDLFINVNSVFTFFVYFAINRQFKSMFMTVFCNN
ncbi:neuromedin-U receptor 2 [Biomphalaria glabrata]|nr:neuromedin-U receptor 2 [Biomphalaria glabrata]